MAVGNGNLYDTPLPVTLSQKATALAHRAAVTGLVLIKAGETGVFGGFVSNPDLQNMVYLHCFDAATVGAVTLGTTVPRDVFHIPAQSAFGDKWSNTVPYANGLVIAALTDLLGTTLVSTPVKASLYIS